jgi:predicted metal-binding protein
MELDKYRAIAEAHGIRDVMMITPSQIVFDVRAILKCRWGCDNSKQRSIKCETHGLSIEERRRMVDAYGSVLLLHGGDARKLTHACLEIERELFLDGCYFAFTLRSCNYCGDCGAGKGGECSFPEKVRPCEEMFGIDVFRTAANLGLPLHVLRHRDDPQNRYGFVLVE